MNAIALCGRPPVTEPHPLLDHFTDAADGYFPTA